MCILHATVRRTQALKRRELVTKPWQAVSITGIACSKLNSGPRRFHHVKLCSASRFMILRRTGETSAKYSAQFREAAARQPSSISVGMGAHAAVQGHGEIQSWLDGSFRAVSQLLWPDKDREVWFSLEENHEKSLRFPDFLQRGTSWEK